METKVIAPTKNNIERNKLVAISILKKSVEIMKNDTDNKILENIITNVLFDSILLRFKNRDL